MKTIGVRDLQKRIRECVEASQTESVVITRNGKPASLVIGVEGMEWEDVLLQSDPAFWEMIRGRRKETSISEREMKKRLASPARKKTASTRER